MKLLVIDNYDSFTHNLLQLIEQAGVSDYTVVKNDELKSIPADSFDKVLISPGPGISHEAGDLMWFINEYFSTKSMLGICLGHEAIAENFGAIIVPMPKPMHGIRNSANIIINDKIFNGLPNTISVGHYHSWCIDDNSLPEEFEVTMRDENGINMAIRHKKYSLFGMQFHPESIMTDYGLEMMKNWLF